MIVNIQTVRVKEGTAAITAFFFQLVKDGLSKRVTLVQHVLGFESRRDTVF